MSDCNFVYIEPDIDQGERMWCEDDVFDPDDYDGKESVKYIRHDLHQKEVQRLETDAKNLADTNRILCHDNLKLSNQIEAMRRECENGKAATELLTWFAKGISEAPPEELSQIVADGYQRIVNLANVIGKE